MLHSPCHILRLISKRWSRDSLPYNHNLIGFHCCNSVILNILAYKTGQNAIYRYQQPSRTLINQHASAKIHNAPLTLIFMIGQGACHCLFSLYRQPILRLCITKNKSLFNYLTYKTKNCWGSVDAHFQDWAGSMSLSVWPLKAANTSLMHNKEQITFQLSDLHDEKSLTLCWRSF